MAIQQRVKDLENDRDRLWSEVQSLRNRISRTWALSSDRYPVINDMALVSMVALPLSTGQCWIMPMARQSTDIATIPWSVNGVVNGTWRNTFLSNGLAYNSFDGSSDWLSWADGTYTEPRYSLTWIGWVRFDGAAGASAEMIVSKYDTGGDATWFVDRRDTSNGGTLYAGYRISSTTYNCESSAELEADTWYCIGFTYDYDAAGAGLFLGNVDGTHEWITNDQTGVLDDSTADFCVGAYNGGGLLIDGDIARPWALLSQTVTEDWFKVYLRNTKVLFN